MDNKEFEFYGYLIKRVVTTDDGNELISWRIHNPELTRNNEYEIDDGDYLQVFDRLGKLYFSKIVYRDYDSLYNPRWKKQIYNGMSVEWLPEGVSTDYWFSLFNANNRAMVVKEEK